MSEATKRLSSLLKEMGDVRVQFGLRQQGHLDTVERMRAEGASWDDVGKAIGWTGEAVERFYEIESDPFRQALLQYRYRLREALYRRGVLSNPGVTDDWILDRVEELLRS